MANHKRKIRRACFWRKPFLFISMEEKENFCSFNVTRFVPGALFKAERCGSMGSAALLSLSFSDSLPMPNQ